VAISVIVADLVVAAEAVAAAVEARCATSQGVMETVEDPGVTAVILIPHPLLHLICVNEWMAMEAEATEVVAAAGVVMVAPAVILMDPAILTHATNPWAVVEVPPCLTDVVAQLATLHPYKVDVETWVDPVLCADLIRTPQGTLMVE